MLFFRRHALIVSICLLLALLVACGTARRNRSGGKRRRQNLAKPKPQAGEAAVGTSAGNRTSDPAESNASLLSALLKPDAAATEPNADQPPVVKPKKSRRKRKRGKKGGKGKRKGKKRGGKRKRKNKKSGGAGSAGKLRATMKKIFGFDHMMSPRPIWSKRSRLDAEVEEEGEEKEDLALHPPEFMLELYRILSQDRSMMNYHFESQGNTVRSFFSVAVNRPDGRRKGMGRPITIISTDAPPSSELDPSSLGGTSTSYRSQAMKVFAFNVTTIPKDEAVLSAELRLDSDAQGSGTRRAGNASDWTVFVGVYRLTEGEGPGSPKVHRRVGQSVKLIPGSSSFWTNPGLGEAVAASTQPGHILIARFHDRPDLSRTARDLAASQNPQTVFGGVPTLPESFTVADSERPKRNSGGRPTPSSNRPDADFDLPPRIPFLIVYCNDSKSVPRPTPAARLAYQSLLTDSRKRRSHRRVRRSVKQRASENEGENDTTAENEFPEHAGSSQQTVQGADASESSSLSNRRTEPPASSVMATLKPRKASKRRGRKSKSKSKSRRCKRRGKKGKKRCKPKKSTTPETEPNASSGACGRKEMLVDFQELGWEHWIVAPHTMQLYYCTGGCEHGSMQDPTNHAIIQSLIKSLGFNTEVSNPCCVPSKLSPVSMLYFDESELLVLKSYPDMEVNSCACR